MNNVDNPTEEKKPLAKVATLCKRKNKVAKISSKNELVD